MTDMIRKRKIKICFTKGGNSFQRSMKFLFFSLWIVYPSFLSIKSSYNVRRQYQRCCRSPSIQAIMRKVPRLEMAPIYFIPNVGDGRILYDMAMVMPKRLLAKRNTVRSVPALVISSRIDLIKLFVIFVVIPPLGII